MVETNKIFVSNENIKLEAEYYQSTQGRSPEVLITHPHPDYGGTMHNNVVSAIFNILLENDITCLRFNFTGVGKSRTVSISGKNRIFDVKTCIDFLEYEKNIDEIIICGYSYGAAIGCSTINYSVKVKGFIAISFPFDFMGKKYKKLSQSDKPKFFIQGDQDNVAVFQNFKKHYEEYDEPKEYVIIEGADHFYRGYEDKITHEVLKFYQKFNPSPEL